MKPTDKTPLEEVLEAAKWMEDAITDHLSAAAANDSERWIETCEALKDSADAYGKALSRFEAAEPDAIDIRFEAGLPCTIVRMEDVGKWLGTENRLGLYGIELYAGPRMKP